MVVLNQDASTILYHLTHACFLSSFYIMASYHLLFLGHIIFSVIVKPSSRSILYYIILYHIISYYIISYHIISYYIILYYIISYYIIVCYIMLYYMDLHYIILCYIYTILYYITLYYIKSILYYIKLYRLIFYSTGHTVGLACGLPPFRSTLGKLPLTSASSEPDQGRTPFEPRTPIRNH